MKNPKIAFSPIKLLLALSILIAPFSAAHAQGTAFTYQGRLGDGGNPANGSYDLTFAIYDAVTNGNLVAGPRTNSAVSAANGVFTVSLDFGNIFSGNSYWLQLGVRTNGGSSFTALSPRQPLTPAPYALYAPNAGTAAVANGTSASSLVQGQGLQIGANNTATGVFPTLAGGVSNSVSGSYGEVLGGFRNTAGTNFAAVAAGSGNVAGGDHAFVAGGENNVASGDHAFVGSGKGNKASSDEDVVVGGVNNSVSGDPAFIGAGTGNTVGGQAFQGFNGGLAVNSYVVAGTFNSVLADNSGIGGGADNLIQTNASFSFIGGGSVNYILPNSLFSTITGGSSNKIQASLFASTIGGGAQNVVYGNFATVGGGAYNTLFGGYGTVGGGYENQVTNVYATVPGGLFNLAGGYASFAAGNHAQAIYDGSFVWADDSSAGPFASTAVNQFLIRASNGVGINKNNPAYALDVNGSVNITGQYLVNGVAQSGSSQWTTGGGGSIYYSGGNVGIGTSTPGAKLDVAGNVHLSGPVPAPGDAYAQTVTPRNLVSAWGLVKITSSGTITLLNGFNVSSVASGGSFLDISFASPLNTASYAVTVQDGRPDTGGFPTTINYQPDFYSGQRSASFFLLRSDSIGNWGAPPRDITFSFVVIGG